MANSGGRNAGEAFTRQATQFLLGDVSGTVARARGGSGQPRASRRRRVPRVRHTPGITGRGVAPGAPIMPRVYLPYMEGPAGAAGRVAFWSETLACMVVPYSLILFWDLFELN